MSRSQGKGAKAQVGKRCAVFEEQKEGVRRKRSRWREPSIRNET